MLTRDGFSEGPTLPGSGPRGIGALSHAVMLVYILLLVLCDRKIWTWQLWLGSRDGPNARLWTLAHLCWDRELVGPWSFTTLSLVLVFNLFSV